MTYEPFGEPGVCIYCGLPAHGLDHVPPRAITERVELECRYRIVPSCRECNCGLGAIAIVTLDGRRRHLLKWYRRRYKRLLQMPDWTEEELAALGPTMRNHVLASQAAAKLLRLRMARLHGYSYGWADPPGRSGAETGPVGSEHEEGAESAPQGILERPRGIHSAR